MKLFFCSSEILACSGVDLDHFALFDEDRNLNDSPCFNSSRFQNVCCSVALYARLCFDDLQIYKVRSLYHECIALEEFNCSFILLS